MGCGAPVRWSKNTTWDLIITFPREEISFSVTNHFEKNSDFPCMLLHFFAKKKVFKETHFFHYFGVIRFFLLLPRKRTKQLFSWKLEEAVIKKEARKISVVLIEAKLCENGYLRGRRTEVQLKMAGLPTISSFIVQEFEGGRGNNLINVLQLVTFWKIEKGLVKSLWKRRFKSKCVFSFHFYFIFLLYIFINNH